MLERPANDRLDDFWRKYKGNMTPIMFVDLEEEGQDKTVSSKTDTKVSVDSKFNMEDETGSSKTDTKVGVNSKFNTEEATLVVS